jgi:serine/threonine-protein kinase
MIRLRTLGSVELQAQGGEDVRAVLAQPKRLALLVYLAAARPFRVHRRDDLLALFWPDLDEVRARDALNQALRFIRQSIGADAFVKRSGEEVGLDRERVWCDAAAFQEALESGRAAEALELYRGPFLQGFFIEEGGGFEEWMDRERAGLREAAARGARQLADEKAEAGALTLALEWGRKALDLAPDDERALRRLLLLHGRAGDRAGALRAYEQFAARLESQFGGDPSAESRALIEQIRSGKLPTADRGAQGTVPRPDPAVPAPERYRIEGKIGEGGMATVYLARDLKHDREVALKVLRPKITESVARERFIREIKIASRLQHPNIVPLFDSGEMEGQLFYVMPHVRGESLRERIRREGPLTVEFATHVLREVAGALAYAHGQGIVHRDIKPDNILLIDRRALLTDFGIARAAQVARTPTEGFDPLLTQPGTRLGTPAYMAPEQASGEDSLDSRADLYALGVVGYEMLTGQPPFTGATPQELLTAQLTGTPDPIEARRPGVPPPLSRLVLRCLAKSVDARPASAQAILGALDETVVPAPRRVRINLPTWTRIAAGLVLLALITLALWPGGTPTAPPTASADTSRYAILPFARGTDVPINLPIEQLIQEAMTRWDGIGVVDRFLVNDAFVLAGTDRLSTAASARIASGLGAGRFLRGEVTTVGDSLRVYLALYQAEGQGRQIGDGTVRVASGLLGADSALFQLIDGLLLSEHHGGGPIARVSSRSLPARQAFSNGHGAIQEWELARADSAFGQATRLDSTFSEAYLWLAQVRMWRRLAVNQWGFAAARAAADRQRLTPRDRSLAEALHAYAGGNLPSACATLERLTRQEPRDFAAWYGMGLCFARDSVVVPDPHSPSRWAFRSSYAQAVRGYTRAFELLSSIRRSLSARAYEPVRRLLKTGSAYPRIGYLAANPSSPFMAYASYDGDTLGFIPFPMAQFESGDAAVVPATLSRAVREQRRLFHSLAATWAAQDPGRSDAMEALAIATDMLGSPAALDTLKRARGLMATGEDSLRLAGLEVWMRLKFSLPNDPVGIRQARRLADSLLALPAILKGRQPLLFVSLAVLVGRANLAASLTRSAQVASELGMSPELGPTLGPLLVFASLGGPRDSLSDYGKRAQRVSSDLRGEGSERFLVRAATLAGAVDGVLILDSARSSADYLWAAQSALRRGDTAFARRSLDRLRPARTRSPAEDLSLDALFPEAALWEGIGEPEIAARWLDEVLDVLPRTHPQVSGEPGLIGAQIRALVLRARLATRLGDWSTAKRWAHAVELLWSDADPFLQAVVDSMRMLIRRDSGTTQ